MANSTHKFGEVTINKPVNTIFLQLSILNLEKGLKALLKAIDKKSRNGELRREDFFRTFSFFCFSKAESKEFLKLFGSLGIIRYTNHKIYIEQIKNWQGLLK